MRRWQPIFLAVLAAFGALAGAPEARAQSITAQVNSPRAFVDEPLRVVVRISNAAEFEGPTFEPAPDLEIRRLPGEQTSSNISIINGRRSEQRSVAMTFEVVPRRVGAATIPAFTIATGGSRLSTTPIPITVSESNSADLFFLRVRATPATIYVGQRGSLDLELWVRRFTDDGLGVTLDESSMWSLVDAQSSSWGVFGPALQRMLAENRRPRGELRIENNIEYLVYTVSKPFDPIAAGAPQLGEVRVQVEYPTELQRDRSFFLSSGYALAGSRRLSVTPQPTSVSALAVPEGGRPASWNGAVGSFELIVVAKPLEVAVGDPITLTMRLTDRSGTAGLDGLQAPRLGVDPAFSTGFRLPSEAASGVVEGTSKVFTQSIRALSDAVREIPPVELSFFNPASGKYESVRSEPIALRVKPSAVVRLEEEPGVTAASEEKPSFTRVVGGLVANVSVDEARGRETVTAAELAAAAGIPLAIGILPLLLSALGRGADPRAERKAKAFAQFERALSAGGQADAVEQAMLHFIAARLGVSGAGFSRRDAIDGLLRAGAAQPVVDRAEQFLRDCERTRYLGGSIAHDEAVSVARTIDDATRSTALAAERSAA